MRLCFHALPCYLLFLVVGFSFAEDPSASLKLKLRYREPAETGGGRHVIHTRSENWNPRQTAIIVCDFWDYHHCYNAVQRMKQFGPRLNQVIQSARKRGVTIIHSPSDCMAAYKDHAARKRVLDLPKVTPPDGIQNWCSRIPSEESATYPIDQSDGGEDDDPAEHKKWQQTLKELGRNPALPWKKQNDMISIDADKDYISDSGPEVWNVLQARKIKNVILVGVHTNMCVLGRPFGLRQMKRNGMNVVLMRDMTDTMYNPKRWPFVSHYTGTDLIVSHVEKYVCPTISSDQIIGGSEFVFRTDPRPHLVMLIGEREYQTNQTLPDFAEKHLRDFRVSIVQASPDDPNNFPDYKKAITADILLVSVRRRILRPEQLAVFKRVEAQGKPIVGIRTASHAFCLRNKKPPIGFLEWKTFDQDVFGGNYHDHYGNHLKSKVQFAPAAINHPITRMMAVDRRGESEKPTRDGSNDPDLRVFGQGGSLYRTSPLAKGTEILLNGSVLGHPPEPVAWTFKRKNGGKSFYTSLGHPRDFDNPIFVRLLRNAIRWSAGMSIREDDAKDSAANSWELIDRFRIPEGNKRLRFELTSETSLEKMHAFAAYRKIVRIPATLKSVDPFHLVAPPDVTSVWWNGRPIKGKPHPSGKYFEIPRNATEYDDANWLVIGLEITNVNRNTEFKIPAIVCGKHVVTLKDAWEWRPAAKSFADASRIYLPAKFGGKPEILIEVQ